METSRCLASHQLSLDGWVSVEVLAPNGCAVSLGSQGSICVSCRTCRVDVSFQHSLNAHGHCLNCFELPLLIACLYSGHTQLGYMVTHRVTGSSSTMWAPALALLPRLHPPSHPPPALRNSPLACPAVMLPRTPPTGAAAFQPTSPSACQKTAVTPTPACGPLPPRSGCGSSNTCVSSSSSSSRVNGAATLSSSSSSSRLGSSGMAGTASMTHLCARTVPAAFLHLTSCNSCTALPPGDLTLSKRMAGLVAFFCIRRCLRC